MMSRLGHAQRRDSKLLIKSEYPPHRLIKARGELDAEIGGSLLPNRRKKNRRRWCKGRAGVEHKGLEKLWFAMMSHDWYRFICKNCGRVMDMYTKKRSE